MASMACTSSLIDKCGYMSPVSPLVPTPLPVAVARSSSDGVAIRCVLPVLWMTSCFHTVGPMGQN